MENKLPLLSDNAIREAAGDRFGFVPHATVLCDALEATGDLPLTVGIFGPWGMGKSSFMNVCRDLLKRRGVPTIWFNPWKYDQKDEIWHALIQTVLTEIASDLEERRAAGDASWRERMADTLATVRRLSQAASWLLARRAVGPLTGGVLTPEDADRLKDAATAPDADEYLHVNRFEQDFRDVVHSYTDGGRLVLFVDDLDRCTQDAAITVLDSLKLFLGEASCVFVLAMDQQVITEAAARKLGGAETPDPVRGQQYLEKLIHLPYHLPGVPFEALDRQLRSEIRAEALAESRELWELIQVAFGANPRRVRRFVNSLNLTAATLALRHPPSVKRLLHAGALLAMRMLHPAFFVILQEDPGIWSRFDQAETQKSPLAGRDETVDKENPGIGRLIAAVSSHRVGFDFPPPPTPEELRLLTEVLTVTGGLPSAPEDQS